MKLNALKVNPAAIEGGEWVADIPECGDLRIRTKGLNNAAYEKRFQALVAAAPRADKPKGRLTPAAQRRITNICLAETCLLDWEGLTSGGAEDAPIPFSREKALELICDPQYEPFRDACIYAAAHVARAGADDAEEREGNSSAT